MATFFRAEINCHNGDSFDCDFPARETRDEAAKDARNRLSDLTERERSKVAAWVREWSGDESVGVATRLTQAT